MERSVSIAALVFALCAPAAAEPRAALSEVVLSGDAGTISGVIEIGGANSGTFVLHLRKSEVRNGELSLSGPLTASVGRATQTIPSVAMRLSDVEGVCESMAVTNSTIRLTHLGFEIDSAAVDLSLSANSTTGRGFATLICSLTHLLDEPGPLTTAAASLNAVANRSISVLAATGGRAPRVVYERPAAAPSAPAYTNPPPAPVYTAPPPPSYNTAPVYYAPTAPEPVPEPRRNVRGRGTHPQEQEELIQP